MSSDASGSGSLTGLSEDINTIYQSYTNSGANASSVHSLNPNTGSQAPALTNQGHLPHFHILSRLSQLNVDLLGPQLAPDSPGSLVLLFDYRPPTHVPQAVTNSLLNVLLDDDTPPVSRGEEEWREKGAAVRTVGEGAHLKVIKRTVGDFKFGRSIGEGLYLTVVLATDKHTGKQYAVKVLDKRHIIKEKKVKYVNIEKHALNRLSNRMGVISLYFTFQDKNLLYFVLDFAANGELLGLIKKYTTLNEDCVRHFGAQILDAIKYMHDNGVIHRDIKPENILLDDQLRIQITDFGTARLLEKKDDELEDYPLDVRAKLFVGTAEYVLPELLELKYCGKPGDIWAFGCIIYQMIAGKPPFKATNEYLTFQKITKLQYAFTAGFPIVIRDLIKHILVLAPSKRFTIDQIQRHYFFQLVQWNDFDLIWGTNPPELGPFKMLAKLMMQIPPEITKAYSLPVITTKKVYGKQQRKHANNSQSSLDDSQASTPTPLALASLGLGVGIAPVTNVAPAPPTAPSKPVNPAKAAAFVLNKRDQTPESTPTASRTLLRQDFIPGTNILRPQINTRTLFPVRKKGVPSPSSTPRQPSVLLGSGREPAPPKPRTLDVTPLLLVELAWQKYLQHDDERILRIGPAIVHKESTDMFERKHKGLLHNPIAQLTRLDATGPKTNLLLSKVVNGASNGLRGTDVMDNTNFYGTDGDGDESQAILDHVEPPEDDKKKLLIFKKFLHTATQNTDEVIGTSQGTHPLDKPRTCTVLCTTHGRVLIFSRNENDNYKLLMELRLNHLFMRIKEVLGSLKFKLLMPTVGTFAVMLNVTTFIFEVEKYEVTVWTEALATAKLNEYERQREIRLPPVTPKTALSPTFANPDPKLPKDSKLMRVHRSVKRKPPPILPPPGSGAVDMSTGFLSPLAELEFLHAAQLAAAAGDRRERSLTEYRRSSFSKEHSGSPPTAGGVNRSSLGKGHVTSMNSKFLARSHRKPR